MRIEELSYDLPEALIAQVPIEPRHDARLLDARQSVVDHEFWELSDLLFPGDLVVVNNTKVRQARLVGHRADTGGTVELLVLEPLGDGRWEALVRPARRIREGLQVKVSNAIVNIESDPVDGKIMISFAGDAEALIADRGTVPLPPYIHETLSDPDRYQTMFANQIGSAAAPTAGLHFTPYVTERLMASAIPIVSVDLHVGLDTFRPISVESVEDHQMHSEWYSVPEATVQAISDTRKTGGRIVAIGTTVVRSLESAAAGGGLRPVEGRTSLFITPGFEFRVVDDLVTNFHVPGSTLLAMISAFMGPRWRDVYAHAVGQSYRMLSFGDAMLASRRLE
jgi:S-adenosylmethionine:tRNA ribosyltransferase-isomerase